MVFINIKVGSNLIKVNPLYLISMNEFWLGFFKYPSLDNEENFILETMDYDIDIFYYFILDLLNIINQSQKDILLDNINTYLELIKAYGSAKQIDILMDNHFYIVIQKITGYDFEYHQGKYVKNNTSLINIKEIDTYIKTYPSIIYWNTYETLLMEYFQDLYYVKYDLQQDYKHIHNLILNKEMLHLFDTININGIYYICNKSNINSSIYEQDYNISVDILNKENSIIIQLALNLLSLYCKENDYIDIMNKSPYKVLSYINRHKMISLMKLLAIPSIYLNIYSLQ